MDCFQYQIHTMCRGKKRKQLACTTRDLTSIWVDRSYPHFPSSRYTRTSSSCSLPQMEPHVLAGHTARLVVSFLLTSLIPRSQVPLEYVLFLYECWSCLLHTSSILLPFIPPDFISPPPLVHLHRLQMLRTGWLKKRVPGTLPRATDWKHGAQMVCG